MTRLYLLILLLTVVYSWDELKSALVVIFRRRNQNSNQNFENDTLVADIVLIATVPFSLAYLILSLGSLGLKLLVVTAEILILGFIFKGLEIYRLRRRFTQSYEGTDKIIAIVFSLLGLVSPSWKFATRTIRASGHTSQYLFALGLPLLSGLALAIAVRKLGPEEFISRLDPLIAVATLGLVLNVTIEILEKIFRSHKFQMMSLMRIVLGIVIIFVLARI